MNLPKWLRSIVNEREVMPAAPETTNDKTTADEAPHLLQLPGEIRNQIYSYLLYSELKCVTIVNCDKNEHLGGSVLSLPLFRVSRQIRAETLSLLCATKTVKIMGIDTANTFFRLNGTTVSALKILVLVQPAFELKPQNKNSIDCFFGFMAEANALREFRLEGVGRMISLQVGGVHCEFLKCVEGLARGGEVKIQMRFGRRQS